MTKLSAILLAVAMLAPVGIRNASACGDHADKPAATGEKKPRPAKVATASFKVDSMHCEGCSGKVTAKLNGTDGIVSVKVSLADHRVTVEYDPSKLDTGKIAKLIGDAGYPATTEA